VVADRTIVRPVTLPIGPLYTLSFAKGKPEVAKQLEALFRAKQIEIVSVGDRLALVMPLVLARDTRTIDLLARGPSPADNLREEFPRGSVNLLNVDLETLLKIYADVTGQFRKNGPKIVSGLFSFQNQTPLTRAEMKFAFDTLLAWQDLRAEQIDSKSFRVVTFRLKDKEHAEHH